MLFPSDAVVRSGGAVYFDDTARRMAEGALGIEELPEDAEWFVQRDLEPSPDSDPIQLELIAGALRSIWIEMQLTMTRTAYSPVFYEGEDYTVAIFDAHLDRVSQREGFPSQMGAMQQAVRAGIEMFGWDSIDDGDVVVHNSALIGTPHLPEFCMIKPVFRDGQVAVVLATIAHHADVGGVAPGGMPGDSTDVHQEGLILPPVKLFRQGKPDPEIWRVILANTRTAASSYGDFMAMYGSLVTGERRINELLDKYGHDTLRLYMRELQKYSERRMRAAIREIPNGIYRAEILADDDGVTADPHRITMALRVFAEDVVVDFRGSDEQAAGPINCPLAVSLAACANAVFNLTDPSIPHNQGAFAPIHVIAPAGTIVNCDYPAPLSAGNTETHNLVAEVVMAGLRQAVPTLTMAPTGATTGLITGGGRREADDDFYTFVLWEPTGYGARLQRDGYMITTWVAPQARQFPTEVVETEQPWRVLRYELRKDSAGAGRTRGGLGLVREYQVVDGEQVVNSIAHYHRFAAQGVEGGMGGKPLEVRIRTVDGDEQTAVDRTGCVSPAKFSGVKIGPGECLVVRMPGGGGWGSPTERSPTALRSDLRDELISRRVAIEVYGLAPDEASEICARYSWEDKRAAHRQTVTGAVG